MSEPDPDVDDGRKPTFFASLFDSIHKRLNPQPARIKAEPIEEPEPDILEREPATELHIVLPEKLDASREAFEQFILNMSLCREPLSFELVGQSNRITTQFAAHPADAVLLRRQLQAHFPEAPFQTRESTLSRTWETCSGEETLAVEFGLAREFMLPLAGSKLDPFVGIIGALFELRGGELALFQVLFQPVKYPWPESIRRCVNGNNGRPLFVNRPELVDAAENKIKSSLYAAVVRIAVKTADEERTLQMACDLAGALNVFAHPQGNELIPLSNEEYPFEDQIEDVLRRQTHRTGMLLTSDELIGFVHLPGSAVRSPVLERDAGKSKAAPHIVRLNEGLLIGINEHLGESVPVRLSPDHRVRHMHVIGASGTGKSTLLFNLIQQDIENGQGVAVLDPHGDLIKRILGIIPESRIDDVVLVDPSDDEYSVGFNILSAHSKTEKILLASDLVSVFQRWSTSWGDQMNSVLQNAISAFLERSRPGTIVDLLRFLVELAFRNEFLTSVQDSAIVDYWRRSFPHLSGNKSIGSVLTRLDALLAQKPIRHMVSQQENRLDFAHIMDKGQILLARLPEGEIGRENSHLLGTLLVAKFQQIAMSRQAQDMAARRDFWLYIDEFANFITPSMAEILSSVRKYRIGLTLAHHNLHQLPQNSEVASAVMSHPFTRIVFKVSDDDARKLADGFYSFEAKALRNLEAGRAIARVDRSDFDFNIRVPLPEEPDPSRANKRRQEVITASRTKYARPRAEIEAAEQAKVALTTPELRQPVVNPAATLPESAQAPTPPVEETPTTDSDHTAIKRLIYDEAEALDYTAAMEELLPAGGRVDVVLRRENQTIACEVSVSNTIEYEAVTNLGKCLEAGFSRVVAVCRDRRKLGKIRERFAETNANERAAKVDFFTPDELIAKLFEWAAADAEGGHIEKGKPKKQKFSFSAGGMTEAERQEREKEMLEKIRQRMQGGPSA